MKLNSYIEEQGLIASHVAKKAGVTRQQLDSYGGEGGRSMNLATAEKIAAAMTELGVETTVLDLSKALRQ